MIHITWVMIYAYTPLQTDYSGTNDCDTDHDAEPAYRNYDQHCNITTNEILSLSYTCIVSIRSSKSSQGWPHVWPGRFIWHSLSECWSWTFKLCLLGHRCTVYPCMGLLHLSGWSKGAGTQPSALSPDKIYIEPHAQIHSFTLWTATSHRSTSWRIGDDGCVIVPRLLNLINGPQTFRNLKLLICKVWLNNVLLYLYINKKTYRVKKKEYIASTAQKKTNKITKFLIKAFL